MATLTVANSSSQVHDVYTDKATQFGHKLEALGWHDALSAKLRLEIIAQEVAPTGTVLDVGCGFGDLIPYLHPMVEYTGLDFVESFIDHARSLYPSREFVCEDIMRYSTPHEFVVASGTLAFYSRPTIRKMLSHMWDLADDTLIFNLYQFEPYFFTELVENMKIPKWKIEADYLADDATLFFYKNKEIMYVGEGK